MRPADAGRLRTPYHYYKDPLDAARRYEDCGIRRLHWSIGRGQGRATGSTETCSNGSPFRPRCKCNTAAASKTPKPCADVFGSGAARANLRQASPSRSPMRSRGVAGEFGSAKMILGADTRDGRIAINGWLEAATVGVEELIGSFPRRRTVQVICTDIAKDGMLSGPSVPLYLQLQKTFRRSTLRSAADQLMGRHRRTRSERTAQRRRRQGDLRRTDPFRTARKIHAYSTNDKKQQRC